MNKADHLVFDGGFATELVSNGYEIDGDPLWSARLLSTNQDAVLKVHKSFLTAGADAILSATYQASIDGFIKYLKCTPSDAQTLIQDGAKLVKQSCMEFWDIHNQHAKENGMECKRLYPLACASLGPYCAFLGDASEYTGDYIEVVSQTELVQFHDQRLSIMAKEELDLYVFETIPALAEAEAIMSLIKQYPNQKFAISFSCQDGSRLCHGEKLEDAVKLLNRSNQVVAVGINCTSPIYITSLLRNMQGITEKKLLVMPNSGELWRNKQWLNDQDIPKISSYIEEWIESGVNWVGGCCRTTQSDISDIRRHIYM